VDVNVDVDVDVMEVDMDEHEDDNGDVGDVGEVDDMLEEVSIASVEELSVVVDESIMNETTSLPAIRSTIIETPVAVQITPRDPILLLPTPPVPVEQEPPVEESNDNDVQKQEDAEQSIPISMAPSTLPSMTPSMTPTFTTPINLSDSINKIKPLELAKGVKRHLNRAAHELYCLLHCLIIESECINSLEYEALCICVNNAANGYCTSSGTYSLTQQHRNMLRDWAYRTSTNNIQNTLLSINPSLISKEKINVAISIINRGNINSKYRKYSFITRIKNSLTPSHVHLYQWCLDIVQLRRGTQSIASLMNYKNEDIVEGNNMKDAKEKEKQYLKSRIRKSSLSFHFLPTIPTKKKYVETIADQTMHNGRKLIINEIKHIYKMNCPGKNINNILKKYYGKEVILLRKIRSLYINNSNEDTMDDLGSRKHQIKKKKGISTSSTTSWIFYNSSLMMMTTIMMMLLFASFATPVGGDGDGDSIQRTDVSSMSTTHSWKFDYPLNGSTIYNGITSIRLSPDALLLHNNDHLLISKGTSSVCIQSLSIGSNENYNSVCFHANDYQWKHFVMDATVPGWIGVEATGWSNGEKVWVATTIFFYSHVVDDSQLHSE
jgi:hypothetical protein